MNNHMFFNLSVVAFLSVCYCVHDVYSSDQKVSAYEKNLLRTLHTQIDDPTCYTTIRRLISSYASREHKVPLPTALKEDCNVGNPPSYRDTLLEFIKLGYAGNKFRLPESNALARELLIFSHEQRLLEAVGVYKQEDPYTCYHNIEALISSYASREHKASVPTALQADCNVGNPPSYRDTLLELIRLGYAGNRFYEEE